MIWTMICPVRIMVSNVIADCLMFQKHNQLLHKLHPHSKLLLLKGVAKHSRRVESRQEEATRLQVDKEHMRLSDLMSYLKKQNSGRTSLLKWVKEYKGFQILQKT